MWLTISQGVHTALSIALAVGVTVCLAGGWWRRNKNPEVSRLLWTTGAFCVTCLWYEISQANQRATITDALIWISICALIALFVGDVRSNSDK